MVYSGYFLKDQTPRDDRAHSKLNLSISISIQATTSTDLPTDESYGSS